MRQKNRYATIPPPFAVERVGRYSALVTFNVNVEEVEVAGEEPRIEYEADTYVLSTAYTTDIFERIDRAFQAWLGYAQNIDYEATAATVRAKRNALLSETDAEMVLDRLGIDLPDTITAATLLATVRSFFSAIRTATAGGMASYRRALRDLPEQSGFPYSIDWPERPA